MHTRGYSALATLTLTQNLASTRCAHCYLEDNMTAFLCDFGVEATVAYSVMPVSSFVTTGPCREPRKF